MIAISIRVAFVTGCLLIASAAARAQTTQRMSVDSSGAQAHGYCAVPSLSRDGRFVAFAGAASDLVPGDTNGRWDVFVHDRLTAATERVSVDSLGMQGNDDSSYPSISGDGRYVAFVSYANNLVAGDTNQVMDVFVRDRLLGSTVRVSVDLSGANSNGTSYMGGWGGGISFDGRLVAFESEASNLVFGDTNAHRDSFVRDLVSGTTERVSLSTSGLQGNGTSGSERISSDGRFVAFMSDSSNFVAGDNNQHADIFVRDRVLGTTEIVSISSSGAPSNGESNECCLSGDGRYVAFTSAASTLVAGDTNAAWDVYLRDRLLGSTERISVSSSGVGSNAYCWGEAISGDGRYVAFMSGGTNLVAGDTNGSRDVFLRDRMLGTTERVSVGSGGAQGTGDSDYAALSLDGRYVAFQSIAPNLVFGDTNGTIDIFGRDWLGAPGSELCEPGIAGVLACPCANPPANSPRGCDNSSGTGGARLSSSGSPSLWLDTLVFTTDGERPTAASVLIQGSAEIASGIAFGQGVRCVGGSLNRLFVKSASGGSIMAPAPGDPSISARSAALGSPIQVGTNRWYAVYYGDPVVLGGCPATSTYNSTQTQLISWGL